MKENWFQITVTVLLVVLIAVQFLPPPGPSEQCALAIEEATELAVTGMEVSEDLWDLYNSGVYERAENINQQNFLANETQFAALQIIALNQAALLSITANCEGAPVVVENPD